MTTRSDMGDYLVRMCGNGGARCAAAFVFSSRRPSAPLRNKSSFGRSELQGVVAQIGGPGRHLSCEDFMISSEQGARRFLEAGKVSLPRRHEAVGDGLPGPGLGLP